MDLTRICLEDFSENFLELYTRHENILRSPTNLLKVQCWVLMGATGSEELHLSHTSAVPGQKTSMPGEICENSLRYFEPLC